MKSRPQSGEPRLGTPGGEPRLALDLCCVSEGSAKAWGINERAVHEKTLIESAGVRMLPVKDGYC